MPVITLEEAYEILGLTSDSSEAQVKSAYKKLALKMHPDKNPNDPEAHKNFLKISEAYKRITDPDSFKDDEEGGEMDEEEMMAMFSMMFMDMMGGGGGMGRMGGMGGLNMFDMMEMMMGDEDSEMDEDEDDEDGFYAHMSGGGMDLGSMLRMMQAEMVDEDLYLWW